MKFEANKEFPENLSLHNLLMDFKDIYFLALYWKCACVGPIFLEDAFTKCVHIRKLLDI